MKGRSFRRSSDRLHQVNAAAKSSNSFRATRCSYTAHVLTHWGRVTYICVSKLTIIGSDNGLSSGRRQAIFWTSNIVNWTLTIKLQWNLNRNFYIFIHENAFENAVWKMAATSSRPRYVNAFFSPWYSTRYDTQNKELDIWCHGISGSNTISTNV